MSNPPPPLMKMRSTRGQPNQVGNPNYDTVSFGQQSETVADDVASVNSTSKFKRGTNIVKKKGKL